LIGRDDLRAALPGWIAARVLVAVAWLVMLALVGLDVYDTRPAAMDGLFAWDADHYRDIAEDGYASTAVADSRFYPLLPVLGLNALGLILLVNIGALLGAALVHRLTLDVTGDGDLARRATTLVSLAPPAFCLVWAYSESLFIALTALHLLCLQRRSWIGAGIAGTLAALTRPFGVLLAIPALVTAVRARDGARAGVVRAFAVLAPIAATAAWLWWVSQQYGDVSVPFDVQADLRDGARFPPFRIVEVMAELVVEPLGNGRHAPAALLAVVLAWVTWRRFPLSWALYAAASVLIMLSAANLDSIERYVLSIVPLVVAGAALACGRWWRPVLAVSCAGLLVTTILAWDGRYVP
jgi:hypothetical protein